MKGKVKVQNREKAQGQTQAWKRECKGKQETENRNVQTFPKLTHWNSNVSQLAFLLLVPNAFKFQTCPRFPHLYDERHCQFSAVVHARVKALLNGATRHERPQQNFRVLCANLHSNIARFSILTIEISKIWLFNVRRTVWRTLVGQSCHSNTSRIKLNSFRLDLKTRLQRSCN